MDEFSTRANGCRRIWGPICGLWAWPGAVAPSWGASCRENRVWLCLMSPDPARSRLPGLPVGGSAEIPEQIAPADAVYLRDKAGSAPGRAVGELGGGDLREPHRGEHLPCFPAPFPSSKNQSWPGEGHGARLGLAPGAFFCPCCAPGAASSVVGWLNRSSSLPWVLPTSPLLHSWAVRLPAHEARGHLGTLGDAGVAPPGLTPLLHRLRWSAGRVPVAFG